MDQRDLELLRAFRAHEAEPPDHLQERIEDALWQAIQALPPASSPDLDQEQGALPPLYPR